MKPIYLYILIFAILQSCQAQTQPRQTDLVSLSGKLTQTFLLDSGSNLTIIFKDAPPQNDWRGFRASANGELLGTLFYNRFFTPKEVGYDTLTIDSLRLKIFPITHLYRYHEDIYIPLVAGDSVLFTYDSLHYPQIRSLTCDRYTHYYNLPLQIPEYRISTGFSTFTAIQAIRIRRTISEETGIDPSTVLNDLLNRWEIFAEKLDNQIEPLRLGDNLDKRIYTYYKSKLEIEKLRVRWTALENEYLKNKTNREILELKLNEANSRQLLNDTWMNSPYNRAYLNFFLEFSIPARFNDQMNPHPEHAEVFQILRQSTLLPPKTKKKLLRLTLSAITANAPADTLFKYTQLYLQAVDDTIMQKRLKEMENASSLTFKNDLQLIGLKGDSTLLQNVLSQHKGKVVYIDFWASWCKPCRHEMPPAKQLRQEYKNKDVVFLYLGIYDQVNDWRKAIKEVETDYLGKNYFINNPKAAQFIQQHNVKRIPRYMIYDRNGKLVQTNAPRPGTAQIRTLLNEYLKK